MPDRYLIRLQWIFIPVFVLAACGDASHPVEAPDGRRAWPLLPKDRSVQRSVPFTLSWECTPESPAVRVQLAGDSMFVHPVIDTVMTARSSLAVLALAPGGYWWRVGIPEGGWSDRRLVYYHPDPPCWQECVVELRHLEIYSVRTSTYCPPVGDTLRDTLGTVRRVYHASARAWVSWCTEDQAQIRTRDLHIPDQEHTLRFYLRPSTRRIDSLVWEVSWKQMHRDHDKRSVAERTLRMAWTLADIPTETYAPREFRGTGEIVPRLRALSAVEYLHSTVVTSGAWERTEDHFVECGITDSTSLVIVWR